MNKLVRVSLATLFIVALILVRAIASHPRTYERERRVAGRLDFMGFCRDPFQLSKDKVSQETEFGFGAGMYPDPRLDYSDGGVKSMIPIADPTNRDQLLALAMIKRTDVSDPNDVPSPYVKGNTDRFGAGPPLVRETRRPRDNPRPRYTRPRMERSD